MSLTVHLPHRLARNRQQSLQLPGYENDDDDDRAISVEVSTLLHSDDRFHILAGSLVTPAGATLSAKVVCKLSYVREGMDCLVQEASVYRALKHLQGKVIPRCYGHFEDLEVAGCLVLEYAGEALHTCFANISDELK